MRNYRSSPRQKNYAFLDLQRISGESFVTWELFDEGDNKTRVRLTHTGLETFRNDTDLPRENFVKGWTHITGTSLKNYLEKE